MTEKQITHILVIDDDKRIGSLLSQYLIEHGFVVSVASDAEQAWEIINKAGVDLFIVDIMMPGETGIAFTKKLRTISSTPVIMLTALAETEARIEGLESGADDYLSKPFEPKELLLRIHNILHRIKPQNNPITYFGQYSFNASSKQLSLHGSPIHLTEVEQALLCQLISHANSPLTREELAQSIGNLHPRSIDVAITRLRNKIETNPKQPQFIQTIRGKGYQFFYEKAV